MKVEEAFIISKDKYKFIVTISKPKGCLWDFTISESMMIAESKVYLRK